MPLGAVNEFNGAVLARQAVTSMTARRLERREAGLEQ